MVAGSSVSVQSPANAGTDRPKSKCPLSVLPSSSCGCHARRHDHPGRNHAGHAYPSLLCVPGPRACRARHAHPVLRPPPATREGRCRWPRHHLGRLSPPRPRGLVRAQAPLQDLRCRGQAPATFGVATTTRPPAVIHAHLGRRHARERGSGTSGNVTGSHFIQLIFYCSEVGIKPPPTNHSTGY